MTVFVAEDNILLAFWWTHFLTHPPVIEAQHLISLLLNFLFHLHKPDTILTSVFQQFPGASFLSHPSIRAVLAE